MDPNPGTKREARIRIERIPEDLHAELAQICQSRRYSKMTDALFFCATIGARILQASDGMVVINGNKSLRG